MKRILLSLFLLSCTCLLFAGSSFSGGDKDKKKRTYNGTYKNGKFHGEGTMKYSDGSVYTGSWEHGVQQGWGHFMWANGDEYEGYLKRGKPEGQGTFYWTDGSDYFGEFKRGEMHGYGKLSLSNGNVFEGNMEDGLRNGPGKVTLKNGIIIQGIYQKGKIDGKFTIQFLDSHQWEGMLTQGSLSGGTIWLQDENKNRKAYQLDQVLMFSENDETQAEKVGWLLATLAVEALNNGKVESAKEFLAKAENLQHQDDFLSNMVQQQTQLICDHCEND